MQRLGKVLGRLIALFVVVGTGLWAMAPQEPVDRVISFDLAEVGDDIDAYLAQREAAFPDITPGTQKRVVWAGQPGTKTSVSVVYIHGFSATSEEIRPVPDQVADALGANLFYTRLAGHGRGGAAMAEPQAGDWIEDMAEALIIGRRIGNRVIVIATSTGGTLAAIAATDPQLSSNMAGVVLVSPNFGLASPAAKILDLPFARWWGPKVAGESRAFTAANPQQARYWTTQYPTIALFPMAALVKEALAQDYSTTKVPALFIYSEQDQVVDPTATAVIRDAWGAAVATDIRVMGPQDDASSHVIAGDILSPGQTEEVTARIVDWARAL